LTAFDPQGEERVLAAVLYRFGHTDYETCLDEVKRLSAVERQALVDNCLVHWASTIFPCVSWSIPNTHSILPWIRGPI